MSSSPSPIGVAVFPVTPLQQNCTLVWCRKTMKAAIIDPGASVDGLLGAVAKQGLTLDAIWITHGHLDHAGGAAEMQEKTGLDIVGPHPADQFWIDGIPAQGQMYGLPQARSFTPTRWLADGDTVTLGETVWEVYHCPGHTPGHVIFFNREARFAQVGDVLFQGSIGRTDFPPKRSRQPAERHRHPAVAAGRRCDLRAGTWPDLDLRRRTPQQSVRVGRGAAPGPDRPSGLGPRLRS